MSLTRQTQKVFASNANANQLAVFGSMKTGTPVYSTSLSTLQSTAYTEGWSEALLNDKAPYMEEMNAVQYGLSYQIAYLLQEGVGAYDANTNYSDTSIVKTIENGKLYFYRSLSDNNLGHALNNTTYWEKISISDTRNIGEIVTSTIPLSDAGLHLLDGSLLSGSGSYSSFISYIAGLYTATPTANYFCTEAQWQASVTQYGVCGKFVYDSVNNTVRLPKYSNKIYSTNLGNSPVKVDSTIYNGSSTDSTPYTKVLQNDGSVYSGGTVNLYTGGDSTGRLAYNGNSYKSIILDPNNTLIADLSNITTSVNGYYYIVVATSTKTAIEVDIDEIATDLNGKADKDFSNVDDNGSSKSAGWAMPSSTYDTLTLGASGSTYTAPANGWVVATQRITNGYLGVATVYTNSDGICMQVNNATSNPQDLNVFIPIQKNETFKVVYGGTLGTATSNRFLFVYAKGSESEGS